MTQLQMIIPGYPYPISVNLWEPSGSYFIMKAQQHIDMELTRGANWINIVDT